MVVIKISKEIAIEFADSLKRASLRMESNEIDCVRLDALEGIFRDAIDATKGSHYARTMLSHNFTENPNA